MPTFTLEQLILFLFAVTPGFFAIQVYSLWYPNQKREGGTSWIDLVCYSLVVFVIWSWWIFRLIEPGHVAQNPFEFITASVLICFLTPAGLARTMYWLRAKKFPMWFGMDHPTRTGWDHFIKNNHQFFVLCRLKSDDMIGGLFAGDSYATTYPIEPEIYIEQLWAITEQGVFLKPKDGSLGTVIRIAECKTIEFFKVELNENEERATDSLREGRAATSDSPPPGGGAGAASPGAGVTNQTAPERNGCSEAKQPEHAITP
jgi:hypothetical protein